MPERNQYQVKTLTIDGKEVCAAEHQTVLEVARENGIDIPTLCNFDGLSGIGACRLCLVEVKGSNKLLPACVTQAQEGMEVTAHSPQLMEFRKLIVELMLTERNHVCAVCVSSGHCELQALAQKLGVNLRTAEGHRAALMRKMNFGSLADLVRYAVRNGIIEV